MWLTLWHLASPMPSLWKVSVKEPGPRPSGYYLAGLRGGRAFLCWERAGCAPAPLPLPQIPPKPLILLTQRHTLSSHGTQGHKELEPRPAAIPPPCCWATVCTLGPRLPQPLWLPSFCSQGPLQAFGLRSLDTFVPFFHPLHEEQTPTPYAWSQQVLLRVKLVGVPRRGPCPAPSPVLGRLGLHPKPGLQLTFHCRGKREAGAQSDSAPGRQRPRGPGWERLVGGPLL